MHNLYSWDFSTPQLWIKAFLNITSKENKIKKSYSDLLLQNLYLSGERYTMATSKHSKAGPDSISLLSA